MPCRPERGRRGERAELGLAAQSQGEGLVYDGPIIAIPIPPPAIRPVRRGERSCLSTHAVTYERPRSVTARIWQESWSQLQSEDSNSPR